MALLLADRVQETTTTTGTGAIALAGAVTNFVTFSSVLSNSDTTFYVIVDSINSDWEVGEGTYSSNTLSRDTVKSSSNAGSLVNFGTGTKTVFISLPADEAQDLITDGLTTSTTFGGDVSGTYNAIVVADDSHNHTIANVDGLQTALNGKQPTGNYLTTSTTFGGDVSGTYDAIAVTNDSHTHAFANLTGKTAGTGEYRTNSNLVAGQGSGSIAMTINDGYGNSNLTFNHRAGTPDNSSATQSACRIETSTDSNTGSFSFEIGNSTVQNTPVALSQVLYMTTALINAKVNLNAEAGLDVTGDVTTTGTITSSVASNDDILRWGNTGYLKRLTTQGGFFLGGDSSGIIHAGDQEAGLRSALGIVDGTTTEALHLVADGAVNIRTNWQDIGNSNDRTWTFDASGNLTVPGNVDGRDVAADGTKLDGIDLNANNYTHPSDGGGNQATLTGATVYDDITINTLGHVTGTSTRDLTLADLGYTGDTNAQANEATDISVTENASTVTIASSTGTDGSIAAATGSLAGVMTATDKAKLDASTASATASTLVERNGSRDMFARLFRSDYTDQASIAGALAFRVSTTDSYIRFCNSPSAIRTFLGVDAAGTNNYTHPTHPGDDFSVDTGALTGATVVSDIDINVTTDTLGHVTDANGSVATRTLTVDDLSATGVQPTARGMGWEGTYGAGSAAIAENAVTWDNTEKCLAIKSNQGDTSIGAAYRAVYAEAGATVRWTVTLKGSAADADGLYLRLYGYSGTVLSDGKTHVSNSSANGSPFVAEETAGNQDTGWYENGAVPSAWTTYERSWTVPATGYYSLVILNWSGFAGTIYVRQPDVSLVKPATAVLADSATSASSATIATTVTKNTSSATSWYDVAWWDTGNSLYAQSNVEIYPASGYLRAVYLNNTHSVSTRNADNIFYTSNDTYIRKNNATGTVNSLQANVAKGTNLDSGTDNNLVHLATKTTYIDTAVTSTPTRGDCGHHFIQVWNVAVTLTLNDASWKRGDIITICLGNSSASLSVASTVMYVNSLGARANADTVTLSAGSGGKRVTFYKYATTTGYWMCLV